MPATLNQIQLATIVAAHYTAVRNSIDEWARRRDQYLTLYITGVGADIGFYVSRPANETTVLLVIGPLTILVILAYASADTHIVYFSRWLRIEYTKMLEKYVKQYKVHSLLPWHWDNSRSVTVYYKSQLRYWSLAVIFTVTNSASFIVPKARGCDWDYALIIFSLAASCISYIFLMHIYKQRKKEFGR